MSAIAKQTWHLLLAFVLAAAPRSALSADRAAPKAAPLAHDKALPADQLKERLTNDAEYQSGRRMFKGGILVLAIGGGIGVTIMAGSIGGGPFYTGLGLAAVSSAIGIPLIVSGAGKKRDAKRRLMLAHGMFNELDLTLSMTAQRQPLIGLSFAF